MILETERLTLAPLTTSDAPLVYPFLSDPEVMAHWDQAPIEDPDEVEACVVAQVAEISNVRLARSSNGGNVMPTLKATGTSQ